MVAPLHVPVPRSLDDVPLVVGIRLDDLVIFILIFSVGFLFRALLLSALLGLGLVLLHRRFALGRPRGHLAHLCYWHGLYPDRGRSFRNAWVRRFGS